MSVTSGSKAHHQQFLKRLDKAVYRAETLVAAIISLVGLVASGVALAAWLSGSHIPLQVVGVGLAYSGWYLAVFLLLRFRRFPSWMRYLSSLLDVTLGSVVMLLDAHLNGPTFAIAAGGPALYAVGVALATLRLHRSLCLLAGVDAAVQLVLITELVIRPTASAEVLASGILDPFLTATKAVFLLTVGILGFATVHLMWNFLRDLSEGDRVRNLLGMHVSEQVVEHLLSGELPEGGQRRAVTLCFTDIRDFTRLSESQPPEETVRLLNLYFGRMCEIVAAHGGLVNKFLGDGMLIIFGAPTSQPDDTRRALLAGQEMVAEAHRMRERGEFPGLRIGVGLHRGEAVVGNVGGAQRQEYTVIGDAVNTASRVQDLTKPLGRALLLTRECREALGDASEALEPLGTHPVKGRQQPLELFSPHEAEAQHAA
jgi:adenylate cyclase